jgi:hypothetical protein
MLRVICLNWILKQAHAKVITDCKNKQTLRHLAWGTSETPQLSDTKCSFSKKWLIKCSCVDDGLTAHLKPQSGLNLIIASAALILNWLQEAKHHLNSNHQFTKWRYTTPMRTTRWTNLWRSCLVKTEVFLNTNLMQKTPSDICSNSHEP